MSKRRKSPKKARTGGGRVTPKGTRPNGAPAGGAPAGGGRVDQQFAGTGFDLGAGGAALDDLGLDFDLGLGDAPAGDPFGPMRQGFLALDLDDPLMVELWASGLIGEFRAELRADTPWEAGDDDLPSEAEFFYDFVGGISRRFSDDEPEWAQLLAAITPFLEGAAQSKAELDLEAVDAPVLEFAQPLGRAVVEETFVLGHETDDGHHIGLVARHPGAAEPHLVMVFVDTNLGGMAKDILIATELAEVRDEATAQGLVESPLDRAEAHARLAAALQRTDSTMMAPVEEDFAGSRPLLERVMASLPEPSRLPPVVEPGDDELAQIVESLVADSSDVFDDELTPDRLADTAGLVTRFMCRDMGRSPVAWSPAALEILLLDYVPRKIAVPAEALAALPGELRALVPAAHRAAGWEDRQVGFTLETIDRVEPEFLELIASHDAWEPQKQFVLRAIDEGIDLEDAEAVAALAERVRAEGSTRTVAAD